MTAPTDPFPTPDPGIDDVVRAQLDAEATRVDARRTWDRVLARLETEKSAPAPSVPPSSPPSRRWRGTPAITLLAAAALAAAVLVAVFLVPPSQEIVASPAEVVQAARDAHGRGLDRCYTQTITLSPEAKRRLPLLADTERRATICVRGNAFVVEPGFYGTAAWGCDEGGRVWVATKSAAIRFAPSELSPAAQEAVQIRGLEFDSLLGSVLADFQLDWGQPPSGDSPLYQITASRTGGAAPFQIKWAQLVIEKETLLVRSLTLRRQLPSAMETTLTFELESTASKNPAIYTAEGHLRPGAHVYDASTPWPRRLVMLKHFGRFLKSRM